MNILSRLGINSLWLIIARIGTQVGMALFTILIARNMGTKAFGEYAFIASLILIGNVLTTFGTDMLLIRDIAATDDLEWLSPALFIQITLSIIFIAIIILISSFMSNEDPISVKALQIYSLSLLPLAFYTIFSTALRGRQCMRSYTIINLIIIVLQVGTALWVARKGANLITLSILFFFVQVLGAGAAGMLCSNQIPGFHLSLYFPIKKIWYLMKACAPIALLSLLSILYQRLNMIILPWLGGAEATGWFSAAARVIEAAKIGHVAVFTAIYPLMAQVNEMDKTKFSQVMRVPGVLLLSGALLVSLALSLLSKPIIILLYGYEYLPSISLLQIIAWMLVPYSINTFLSLTFIIKREESVVVSALIVGILAMVILTIWWVPLAGPLGVAWATLSAEIIQSIILLTLDSRQHQVLPAGGLNGFSKFSR